MHIVTVGENQGEERTYKLHTERFKHIVGHLLLCITKVQTEKKKKKLLGSKYDLLSELANVQRDDSNTKYSPLREVPCTDLYHKSTGNKRGEFQVSTET